MFWKKAELKYDIAIPPLSKPFAELTSREVRYYYKWYLEQIPKRIEYLSEYCAKQMNVDFTDIDLSPESLVIIWRWFLSIAQKERTPRKRIEELEKQYKDCPFAFQQYMLNESREQFSLQTEYIIRDIGIYLGEVFVKNNPSICWGYYEKPKSDFFVNMPVLTGFVDCRFNPPFQMIFEPIHMVGVQAANVWDNSQREDDLLRLYQKWSAFIPQG